MSTTIKPVFYKVEEKDGYLDNLEKEIRKNVGKDADLLLNYPIIYMHIWQSKTDKLNKRYSVYIGETNKLIERNKNHWVVAKVPKEKRKESNWQFHMLEDKDENGKRVVPTLYIFGHKLFHKSLTLDLENRLIDFCLAMPTAHTYNGRPNPQGCYNGDNLADNIFGMIWRILKKDNPDLFLSESLIKKSAIYKVSPNHKLYPDQKNAKEKIIDKVVDAILNKREGQLIMVEGEAGTGKTVLTSSTFFELLDSKELSELNITAFLLVNHDEQLKVYKDMAKKLGFKNEVVLNPTSFIRTHDSTNPVDIVFVDEAHLLWTQKKQSYNMGEKQLDDIVARSKVTVIMFDEYQVLRKEQYVETKYLLDKREMSKKQNNYIPLENQYRMNCSKKTMKWIDDFTKKLVVNKLEKDKNGYEIKLFNCPFELHKAIKEKAKKEESVLSRLVASYDWAYNKDKSPDKQKYWEVELKEKEWSLPWNNQTLKHLELSVRERKRRKALDWAEQEHTINEVGSTFTIQGFDLTYAGVIIGPSVRYDKEQKKVWFDEEKKAYDKMKGNRTLDDGELKNVSDILSQHELRVLLTRGTKGLYIYACDPDLRDALNAAIK